jgi:ligand-binding sensor domain-containing protein
LRGAVDRGKQLDNDYVLISTVKFDKNGHLWVLNNQTEGVTLLEFDPMENKWTDHHNPILTNDNGIGKHTFRSMIIDSRGLLWFVNDSWVEPAVFCCDIENDIIVKYDNFVNQDGTRYSINLITCVCEDKEGNVWVGTDLGPFMIQKNEVGQSKVTFYQVKIPRNDGTDYADYLLSGVSISSIAIDGGNRKWFGSDNAGAFLISADNMQQLQSFTTSNSKLISNNIAYITINPSSGEVFFLSDYGLCSYQSDATEASNDMNDDTVYAYPNPVTPDYEGLITVVGLSFDADVKITSSNGALIAEGRSNGGMFTWDGRDKQGRRVASGVYMVITATSDGNKGTVCKIAVIN